MTYIFYNVYIYYVYRYKGRFFYVFDYYFDRATHDLDVNVYGKILNCKYQYY